MTNVLKNQAAKTQKTRIVSAMADALQYLKTLVSRGVSTAQHHPSPGCYEDTLNSVYFRGELVARSLNMEVIALVEML